MSSCYDLICRECGKRFTSTRKGTMFCCKACRDRDYNRNRRLARQAAKAGKPAKITRCKLCKRMFAPVGTERFCCDEHRQEYRKQKQHEYMRQYCERQKYQVEYRQRKKVTRKDEAAMRREAQKRLTRLAIEASEHNMSYGKYKLYLETLKEEQNGKI